MKDLWVHVWFPVTVHLPERHIQNARVHSFCKRLLCHLTGRVLASRSVWTFAVVQRCLQFTCSLQEAIKSLMVYIPCRQADRAELVELHDHTRWPAPAMGLLGPPAKPQQGSLAPHAAQSSFRQGFCMWCKAPDHAIGQCPLNGYALEQSPSSSRLKADAKQGMQHIIVTVFHKATFSQGQSQLGVFRHLQASMSC